MRDKQFLAPILVRNGNATPLTRVPLDERMYSEAHLQELLYDHPSLIPVSEIEPIYEGLQPVAKEVPTGSGFLDLLFMNGKGYLTLVETKLWRNPEARRTAIAQIIDYATRFSTWTYEDLSQAVEKSRGASTSSLLELAREQDEDFDERQFIDRMNRNLRLGRFVLLIIGDGIHEGVEHMADFLNRTPQLQFRLGLVEMGLYRIGDNEHAKEYFVQPRLLVRTREVTRAVVEIQYHGSKPDVAVSVPETRAERTSGNRLTEAQFFEQLAENCDSEVVELAKRALAASEENDLTVIWGEGGPMFKYLDPDTGYEFNFGQFHRGGTFTATSGLYRKLEQLHLPVEIAEEYLQHTCELIPGAKILLWKTKRGIKRMVSVGSSPKKGTPPLKPIVAQQEKWFAIVSETIDAIREAISDKE